MTNNSITMANVMAIRSKFDTFIIMANVKTIKICKNSHSSSLNTTRYMYTIQLPAKLHALITSQLPASKSLPSVQYF
jgi:hypothetical protein